MSSLTGSDRTLVAVGTVKETSMFLAVRARVPRRVVLVGSSSGTSFRSIGVGGSAGTPPRAPGALGRISLVGDGFSTVGLGRDAAGAGGGWAAGEAWAGAGAGAAVVGVRSRRLAAGASAAVAGFGSCFLAAAPSPAPVPGAPCELKYSAQVSSTELGSVVYRSYISSSSQSLAPKSASGALVDDSSGTMATGRLLPDTSCARVLPAFGLHPACSRHAPGRRYLGYPTLRPGNHWLCATHLVSVSFCPSSVPACQSGSLHDASAEHAPRHLTDLDREDHQSDIANSRDDGRDDDHRVALAAKVAVIKHGIDELGQQRQDQSLSGDPADRRLFNASGLGSVRQQRRHRATYPEQILRAQRLVGDHHDRHCGEHDEADGGGS